MRVTVAALMLVVLIAAIDATILAAAVPDIVTQLRGVRDIGWLTTAFMVAQIAVAPLYGKLGDIHGRKSLLQAAVVIFLLGSLLCGASQTMLELVAARAVQGAGAGGMMVLVQAILGESVSPREQAKYQTLFGALFGVASVGGPLLGGVLVEQISWRWIFFVNLPVGLVTLAAIAIVLPNSQRRPRRPIDYRGAAFLATGLTSFCILVTLAGSTWPWLSSPSILLAAGTIVVLGLFALAERRAADPIIPVSVVSSQVFQMAAALSALLGCAMFAVVTFTPLYFQVVQGDSPTGSGLRLAAMMGGIVATGLVTGQVISRTGRYRTFPIAGFSAMALGAIGLASLDAHSGTLHACAALAIFGCGLGMTMQILVTVVQNAVPREVIGSATSALTVIRGTGSALGPALLGAVFASELGARAGLSSVPAGGVARLSFAGDYAHALRPVYVIAAMIAGVGILLAWRLEELPLRTTVDAEVSGAAPSVAEVEAALRNRASDEERSRFFGRLAARAQLPVSPTATWALVRIHQYGVAGARQVARREGITEESLAAVEAELHQAGLMSVSGGRLTPLGHRYAARASAARCELLSETLSGPRFSAPAAFALLGQLAAALQQSRSQ